MGITQTPVAQGPSARSIPELRNLPLCGNPACEGRGHNSHVDEPGDVVLYTNCRTGTLHLFRHAASPHGLILNVPTGAYRDGFTFTKEIHTHQVTAAGERWTMIPDPQSVCAATYHGSRHGDELWIARHLPTQRVIVRATSQFGLMGRVARFYLRYRADSTLGQAE